MRQPYAWESTLVVFAFLLLLLVLNLVFGAVQAFSPDPLLLSPILIFGELLVLGLTVVWVAFRRLPWQETFYLYRPGWPLLGLSVLVAVTWWPVSTGLGTLMEQLFSQIGPSPEIPPPRSALDALGYFIAIVILAPLCEEPVFRGFIMRGWLRYGFVAGVVGSGVLFGLQHAQLSGAAPLSLVGIMLGVIAFRAGSLWPGIVIHAIYNGIGLPFLIFPDSMPDISDSTLMLAGLIALPAAGYSLWLYHRLAPAFQPPPREPLTGTPRLALIVASALVAGMFLVMILLEIF
ncbi:MAG: type II CAAX endopeptidase family protein, partial [Chloroflexota bacterium]